MKKSESISNLAKALIVATRQIDSKVLKNALNESFGNSYVDLGAIINAIKKPLADNGIVTIQSPASSDKPNEIGLSTLLLHETGEWIEDKDNSSFSTLKRYKEPIQRYKGLGEMDADQLAETTMDKSARSLRRVRVEDAVAVESFFELLMGNEVAPRRDFIIDSADTLERERIDA
jgi:DNA gyrase/topoisomerase IV subunit B